ncbi:hypothetical protein I5515_02425 [Acinetobacter calcoaceticus]|uniref:hypothetical protein n=1 Tax=Acinetobacter calcoaceticus TaxID=471 RepID=UPI0019016CD4|nr:hypothetical protein [Acinetobacter calcoaceticus]MBJ9720651.1 hypothetical protein [Acinetobacter calcoaceticus]
MLNKQGKMTKLIVSFFIFLTGCNLSANTNLSPKKIYELDLTDQGISPEGGGIELKKEKNYCSLILSLYEESGQEKYKFNFKKDSLINTNYLKYRYENGLIEANDELDDLIADDSKKSNKGVMELIANKSFVGNKDKNITKEFEFYKKKIPKSLLDKECN